MSEETQLEPTARLNNGDTSSSADAARNGGEASCSHPSMKNDEASCRTAMNHSEGLCRPVPNNDQPSCSSTMDVDSGEGLAKVKIEKMDEDLPEETEDTKCTIKQEEIPCIIKRKVVLEGKGMCLEESLPLDWKMIHHESGIPIFMHRKSGVCTLSKPYFFGEGSAQLNDIPVTSIPCYAYRQALDCEKKQDNMLKRITEQIHARNWIFNSGVKLENKINNQDQDHSSDVTANNTESDFEEMTIKKEVFDNQEEMCPFLNGEIRGMAKETVANEREESTVESNGKPKEDAGETAFDLLEEFKDRSEDTDVGSRTSRDKTAGISGVKIEDKGIPQNEPENWPRGVVKPWHKELLTADQFNEYCRKLFQFKTVKTPERRARGKTIQDPLLPEKSTRITIPAQQKAAGEGNAEHNASIPYWMKNINGRSYLSVFNEYVLRTPLKKPVFVFKRVENDQTPRRYVHQATVMIEGVQYGVGQGYSKRQAKSAAARNSLLIFIPEMKDVLDAHASPHAIPNNQSESDLS